MSGPGSPPPEDRGPHSARQVSRSSNPWGIHCAECSAEAPCSRCSSQIAAEHAYVATHSPRREEIFGGGGQPYFQHEIKEYKG